MQRIGQRVQRAKALAGAGAEHRLDFPLPLGRGAGGNFCTAFLKSVTLWCGDIPRIIRQIHLLIEDIIPEYQAEEFAGDVQHRTEYKITQSFHIDHPFRSLFVSMLLL
jgi:hypothetical protein